jgi:hypothetical protein
MITKLLLAYRKVRTKKKRLKEITKSVKHVMVCICCQETIKMDEGDLKKKKRRRMRIWARRSDGECLFDRK